MVQRNIKRKGKRKEKWTPPLSVDLGNKKEIKARGTWTQMCVFPSLGLDLGKRHMRWLKGKPKVQGCWLRCPLGSLGRDRLNQCCHNNLEWGCWSQRKIFGQNSPCYHVPSSSLPRHEVSESSADGLGREALHNDLQGEQGRRGGSEARPQTVPRTRETWDKTLVRIYSLPN